VYLADGELAARNKLLMDKYADMRKEVSFQAVGLDKARLVVVAFGSMGRIAHSTVRTLRAKGHEVGLLRPLTLFPFPDEKIAELAGRGARFLVIEQNLGQMVEDVRLAVNGRAPVAWHGVMPCVFVDAEDFVSPIMKALEA
jgi:2-oxoglutarate ferredoxin oxidoreductase subunit alpha